MSKLYNDFNLSVRTRTNEKRVSRKQEYRVIMPNAYSTDQVLTSKG